MIGFPIKITIWGPITNLEDLKRIVNRYGQPFGVDWSGPACNVNSSWPCDKTYYQYLGFGLHKGIDIPCANGTEVYATADGKVVEISDDVTKGIGLVIFHPELKLKTVYWHLQSHNVALGDTVIQGQIIANSDNTGYSLGPHLHFEVKTTDEHGVSINSVDPMLYFVGNNLMSEQEVTWEYNLAFYRDPTPDELAFWSGKPLADFLKTAIKDRANFLAGKIQ